jgi:uncharacterized protein (TIRG00374 family)
MLEKLNWKLIGRLVPIIGIALFIYIIYSIGLEEIIKAFTEIPIHLLLIATALSIPRLLACSLKWKIICKKQKIDVEYSFLTKITLLMFFYAAVTPAAIGYHLRIFYLQKRSKSSLEKSTANSIIETTTNFIVGLFIAMVASLYLLNYSPEIFMFLFTILLILFAFFSTGFYILMTKRTGGKIVNILIRPFIPREFRKNITSYIDLIYEDIPKIRDLYLPILLDCLIWFIAGLQVYVIAMAFSPEVLPVSFDALILCSIISVVAMGILPITVGGLGVREGTFVYLMSTAFGVDPGVAVVISLGGFFAKTVIPGVFGLLISLTDKDFRLKN